MPRALFIPLRVLFGGVLSAYVTLLLTGLHALYVHSSRSGWPSALALFVREHAPMALLGCRGGPSRNVDARLIGTSVAPSVHWLRCDYRIGRGRSDDAPGATLVARRQAKFRARSRRPPSFGGRRHRGPPCGTEKGPVGSYFDSGGSFCLRGQRHQPDARVPDLYTGVSRACGAGARPRVARGSCRRDLELLAPCDVRRCCIRGLVLWAGSGRLAAGTPGGCRLCCRGTPCALTLRAPCTKHRVPGDVVSGVTMRRSRGRLAPGGGPRELRLGDRAALGPRHRVGERRAGCDCSCHH